MSNGGYLSTGNTSPWTITKEGAAFIAVPANAEKIRVKPHQDLSAFVRVMLDAGPQGVSHVVFDSAAADRGWYMRSFLTE